MRFLVIVLTVLFAASSVEAKEGVHLGIEDISKAVVDEFDNQGLGEDVELEFFGGQTSFTFESASDAKIMITDLTVDEGNGKFKAEAEIFADGNSVAKTTLSGRSYILGEVVVPTREIAKDEVIEFEDLKVAKLRLNRLRDDVIKEEDELVGKQATRTLKEGKPVTSRDVKEEVIVKRGDKVTAVYNHKGLQITSKMEALEDGAKGRTIKVLNTKSAKEISGKVLGKNIVEISAE